MARILSYVDAVRVLGGDDEAVRRLDVLAGGALLMTAPAAPAVLALIDAKAEIVRLGRDLIKGLREKRSGLSRYGRTERLAAAHTILVVTAYFEAMAETDMPLRFGEIELSAPEQIAIASGAPPADGRSFADAVVDAGLTVPILQGGHEDFLTALDAYYGDLCARVRTFLTGLRVWEELSISDQEACGVVLDGLPDNARQRYVDHVRSLAADFPEVAIWIDLMEHEATRTAVRGLEPSLARMERRLNALASGRLPAERVGGIARVNRAALGRPIADSGDVPPDLSVPTLAEGFLTPRFRVTDFAPDGGPSNEHGWEQIPVRDDLEDFLFRYLTSVEATGTLMLVLGQPGAGKSVLTRVLAARLPPADYLVVRVPLRDVAAELDVQGQIERAVLQSTGERIAWPDLVRGCAGSMPVILIDGFDELLQATGVRQTDYLTRLADFQRREAELGRPAAILVTTRTSVADRARAPIDTVFVRLEPFDKDQIDAWVTIWNRTNAANFERADIKPLDVEVVRRHADIAGQPLLLLMLALYDADGNALRRFPPAIVPSALYEGLLTAFARREITKHDLSPSADELQALITEDMRRLSIVAFAMFNRQSQWVTESDLELDLAAIFGRPGEIEPGAIRSRLGPAERQLGRFFFVHRARAIRDESALHTYEFLHATFGEYLVARLTWEVAVDSANRDATAMLPTGGVDDGLLHALLSFAALAGRKPIVEFLTLMAARLDASERERLSNLLIRLLRSAGLPNPARSFAQYAPQRISVSQRHAAYSANLVLLAALIRGELRGGDVFTAAETDPVEEWHRLALLWQSQLGADFYSMVHTMALRRVTDGTHRDVVLYVDHGQEVPAAIDPLWTYNIGERRGSFIWGFADELGVRRRANFLCGGQSDMLMHVAEPFFELGKHVVTRFFSVFPDEADLAPSRARALLDVLLLTASDDDVPDRHLRYVRCASVCVIDDRSWSPDDDVQLTRLTDLLLNALLTDRHVRAETAAQVVETLMRAEWTTETTRARLRDCASVFLGRTGEAEGAARERLALIVNSG
ncbi:hypothetical protein OWR29_03455 [Actinoplanes sp. Pm04-4]|uniref:AAA+ ATPase domain-containing protein n=1 Tax=Paractinoplanes pyxinae TaxID=2997416 RepID=A0ABT4AUG3_9ACTN|nr:hypothetical protein [Actinoplanes pyxinae]MCY1137040.1 hypothetical protein [Actinoplanes pyxinae]